MKLVWPQERGEAMAGALSILISVCGCVSVACVYICLCICVVYVVYAVCVSFWSVALSEAALNICRPKNKATKPKINFMKYQKER